MEKIWQEQYPLGMTKTIDSNAYSSLTQMLTQACEKFADKPALENFGVRLSYRQLLQKSKYMASFLQHTLHLKKGDRIAIMMPNLLQYPISILAALQLGLIITNVNPLYTERELLLQLQDSGVSAIVILKNFVPVLESILPHTSIKNVIVTEVGDLFPWPKKFLTHSYLKYIRKVIPTVRIKTIEFTAMLQGGKKMPLEPVPIQSSDVAFLQYTGGTTGISKGAILSHQNLVANILQCVAWIDTVLEEGKEIVVTALPMYHIFSLTICCLAFLHLGALSLLITNPRDFKNFIKQLKKLPFTVFVGVNTLYQGLLRCSDFNTLPFKSLKLSLAGGMSVLETTANKWQQITGKTIVAGYGLTEASPVVTINPLNVSKFTGSIGLPVPSTDISIQDNQGNEVLQGQAGELCIKGPQVMSGYWNNEAETAHVLDEEGWLHTGDIVKMDDDGFLYLVDRKKDMILVSGFNVYPNEIEEVISNHPGVAEVAVIGVPNSNSGEVVKAFIVKKDPNLTKEEVTTFCKLYLTGYKLPKLIEFREQLPKSNIGKVLRQKLREEISLASEHITKTHYAK